MEGSFFDQLKRWFRRESDEARDILDGASSRANSALDRAERDMELTPSERIDQITDEIDKSSSLDVVRDKISNIEAKAHAKAELARDETAQTDDDDPTSPTAGPSADNTESQADNTESQADNTESQADNTESPTD